MSKPLSVYPALPYSNDPEKSFKLASEQTFRLRKLGFYPFSPVNHTHNYHLEIRENYCPKCFQRVSYELATFDGGYHCPKCKKTFTSSDLITDDYYEWDLHLLRGLMAWDGKETPIYKCGYKSEEGWTSNPNCIECDGFTNQVCVGRLEPIAIKHKQFHHNDIKYDSGVIMFMSETAYRDNLPLSLRDWYNLSKEGLTGESDWKSYWHSKGCRLEYEFAIENHILVIKTEKFLEIMKGIKVTPTDWHLINHIIKDYPEVVL